MDMRPENSDEDSKANFIAEWIVNVLTLLSFLVALWLFKMAIDFYY